jgi:hypothetical protein
MKYILGLCAVIILAGCVPQLPRGAKATYDNQYKRSSTNKAFVIASKNGHYVYAYSNSKQTINEAKQSALTSCKKIVSDHHLLKTDDCVLYDVNGQNQ